MKKALLVAAGIVGFTLFVSFAYAVHVVRSLNTKAFQQRILEAAEARLGTHIAVKEMRIDLFSGIELEKAAIANPAPLPGNLLAADAFVLRYRLLPLLLGRMEVDELRLRKPVLLLATDAQGRFNYERLGAGGKGGPPEAGGTPAGAVPLAILLRRLKVEDADIRMVDAHRASVLDIEDAAFNGTFGLARPGAEGNGKASVALLKLGTALRVRSISAPVKLLGEKLDLEPVRGRLAEGSVDAGVSVRFKGGFAWTSHIEVRDAKMERLLAEAGAEPRLAGTLDLKARFDGSAGLVSVSGKGSAEIKDCAVRDVRLLGLLSAVFGVPEIRNPELDECRTEFTLRSGRLLTPSLVMSGPDVRLRGHGVAELRSSTLDYDMNLALSRKLLDRIPAKELRAAFRDGPTGYASIDFKVGGTFDQPRTDLTTRVGKAAAGSFLKSGLDRLFGKKKP